MSLARMIWVFLAVMWGTTWMAASVALRDVPPFTLAGARFLVASAILFVVVRIRRTPFPRALGAWTLMVGTGASAIGVAYAFQFWGMRHVPSAVAAVVFSAVPLLTILLAHWILPNEPITLRRSVGVITGVTGVAIIFGDQLGSGDGVAAWAVLGFVLGAVALAHAQVTIKAHGSTTDPVLLSAVQTLVGGALLLGLGTMVEGNPLRAHWTGSAVVALAYLSVLGSAVGFVALYWLLRRLPVTTVNSMMLVHPLVAIVLGWLVLGEHLTVRALFGAGAIVLGLAAILRPSARVQRPIRPSFRTDEIPVSE